MVIFSTKLFSLPFPEECVFLHPNVPDMISVFDDMSQVTEAEVTRMLPLVNDQRRAEALRYKHVNGQFACLKSWLMLEAMLKPLGISNLEFSYNPHGKPFLKHYPEVYFSLSHCKNGIAVVVDNAPVGVDIESFRKASPSLVSHTMNEEEQRTIAADANPTVAFITLWTQKESVLKLRGTGISTDLRQALDGMAYRLETLVNLEKSYALTVAYSL